MGWAFLLSHVFIILIVQVFVVEMLGGEISAVSYCKGRAFRALQWQTTCKFYFIVNLRKSSIVE